MSAVRRFDLPPGLTLVPTGLVDRRVHAGNFMFMLVLHALSEKQKNSSEQSARGLFAEARSALESTRARRYLSAWQNVDGSWNGSPLQTCLMLVGLEALGATKDDPDVARALTWLDGMKRRSDELDVSAMDNDVWSTALSLLALHAAGAERDEPAMEAGVAYLLGTQCTEPMPRENQRRAGAPRVGGWPFQKGNERMPDTDDTGVVIATLATLAGDVAPRSYYRAIDSGAAWLRGMQNTDGGFPTFVWGMPSKPPGPMFETDLPVEFDDPRALLAAFNHAPSMGTRLLRESLGVSCGVLVARA